MRVGVTGHRRLDGLDALAAVVDDVLERLDRSVGDETPTIVSALAEGADRLVAHRGIERGWMLVVVLPLPRDDYEADFGTTASRAEFDDLLARASSVTVVAAQPTREDAYLAAGHAMVDESDVVLALWDGRPPRGRGGTAEVVTYARSMGRPLVWVDVSTPHASVHLEAIELGPAR